ncbi:MAG: 1-deoxy-D-xylulose-5-phosphate reductoisomerase [Desulfobacterales bacterium]
MKRLTILGSTGSIGCNALKIAAMYPERFTIKVLAAGRNVALLAEQIDCFHPEMAVVLDEACAGELEKRLSHHKRVNIVYGEEGYTLAATYETVDLVVSAMVGAAGLIPTLAAIDAGKHVALANKEALVMAGEIVMKRAAAADVNILPVDSEHSAIYQCIMGHNAEDMDKIFLTASGGPFLNMPADDFRQIEPGDALNHPTWQMGKKISIDSATLMNKGLEVIEATHLFDISHADIEILIHPQSIVHSMVSFTDGSIFAQLGMPDMKGAIAYAMSSPDRLPIGQPLPDFPGIGSLTFDRPDTDRFPCLDLAFDACSTGETMPAVLNAANETAVHAFLDQRVSFEDIAGVIRETMTHHTPFANPGLSDILDADKWARQAATNEIRKRVI